MFRSQSEYQFISIWFDVVFGKLNHSINYIRILCDCYFRLSIWVKISHPMNSYKDVKSLTSSCNRFDTYHVWFVSCTIFSIWKLSSCNNWVDLKPFNNLSMVYDTLIRKKRHNFSQEVKWNRKYWLRANFQFSEKKMIWLLLAHLKR